MKKAMVLWLAAALACTVLAGCSSGEEAASSAVESEVSAASEAAPSESAAEEAPSSEAEALPPMDGSQIADGTYAIEVESSSSMFKIVDAQLTVASGEMTAVLTLSGTGYEKLYMGTAEEALADTDDQCIYFVENAEGAYTYEVPVAALNEKINVAAWSINKETWYDRELVFSSAQIPADAIQA